jgi:hypothetical protein
VPFLALARIHPAVALLLPVAYGAYFESSARPATPGKRLCGLEVMTLASAHPRPLRALARNALKYGGLVFQGSIWSFLAALALFGPVAFAAKRQGIHDRLAGTVVRHEPKRGISPLVVGVLATVVPLLFVVSLLPLITAPYYADQARGQVRQGLEATREYQSAVEKYYLRNGRLPDALADIEMAPPPASVASAFIFSRGSIVIEPAGMRRPGSLTLTPQPAEKAIAWKCGAGGIPDTYLPPQCRGE